MARHEADIVIIGGGITAAMIAEKLTEVRPGVSVIVIDAGKRVFDAERRFEYRQRAADYGEHAWPGDYIPDQSARGVISRAMAVGGSALHWGGVCNRFSEEDTRLKSLYGLAVDWPLDWKDLEKFYCEAERRLGVSGEPSPLAEDWRSEPYPMPAMTMTHNLIQLKGWAEQSGIKFWSTPQAKNTVAGYGGRGQCQRCNTCEICPTGARYSPDWTFKQLIATKKIQLHDETLIRKLVLDDAHRADCRGSWGETGRHRQPGRVSRPHVRRRVRLLLERASAPAFGQLAVPERPRQHVRSRWTLHDRTPGVWHDDRS